MNKIITFDENIELPIKGENRTHRQYPPEVVAAWLAATHIQSDVSTRAGSLIQMLRSFCASVLPAASRYMPGPGR